MRTRKEDIGETKNLAESEAEKLAELTAWSQEIEALIPKPNPDFAPCEGREPAGHFGK